MRQNIICALEKLNRKLIFTSEYISCFRMRKKCTQRLFQTKNKQILFKILKYFSQTKFFPNKSCKEIELVATIVSILLLLPEMFFVYIWSLNKCCCYCFDFRIWSNRIVDCFSFCSV